MTQVTSFSLAQILFLEAKLMEYLGADDHFTQPITIGTMIGVMHIFREFLRANGYDVS